MLALRQSGEKYTEISDERRKAYTVIHDELTRLSQIAVEELGGNSTFAAKTTSSFTPFIGIRGNLPKDLWFAAYNRKNGGSFQGMPQLFAIVSGEGIEVGFAATIHPSDYSDASFRERVRAAAPLIFDALPDADSELARSLDTALRGDTERWFYRKKTRLPPNQTDFASLNDWILFLKSPGGKRAAGGCISTYVDASRLEAEGFTLETLVRHAAEIFAPIMEYVVPNNSRRDVKDQIEDEEIEGEVTDDEGFDEGSAKSRVWIWAPGFKASHWDELYESGDIAIGWDDLGDLRTWQTLEQYKEALSKAYPRDGQPTNDALTCRNFTYVIEPGDRVFVKRGRSTIIGAGTVTGDYRYEKDVATLRSRRTSQWTARGEWESPIPLPMKTLTEVTDLADIQALDDLIAGSAVVDPPEPVPVEERSAYPTEKAVDGLFMPREQFEQALEIWRVKKNLILQGPPGVGKSFVARRLAYALMKFSDPSRVRTVQFHQAYAYEDFVQGFRPGRGMGFELREGVFVEFCRRALKDKDENYVFIIDEINRGNLAKILGELMLLIEPDKRSSEWAVKLASAEKADDRFYVPKNIFILGMMNTADRSLAVVDYALRRRFAFVTLKPAYDAPTFRAYLEAQGLSSECVSRLLINMIRLNEEISQDYQNLGAGYCIGHSFFSDFSSARDKEGENAWVRRIISSEIVPLLQEYWFDDPKKVQEWNDRLLA